MAQRFSESEFLRLLSDGPEAVLAAESHAMAVGAELALAEARRDIGTYQRENMGPISPWAELADSTKADRLRHDYSENDPGLRSGQMRDSYEAESKARSFSVGSNDEVAVVFEEGRWDGTNFQPPRPVSSLAVWRTAQEVTEYAATCVAASLAGQTMPDRKP